MSFLDFNAQADVDCIDSAKVFDCNVIRKLILKLEIYVISGALLKLLNVFLTNCSHRVVIDHDFAFEFPASNCVCQEFDQDPIILFFITKMYIIFDAARIKLE